MARLLILSISLILGIPQAFAAVEKASVETFIKDYVVQVAKGKLTGLEDDSEEFADCAKSACKVVLRRPVVLTNEDEEDDAAPEIFEAQIDVFKSGQVFVRRSGCYVLHRKDGHLTVTDYKYECSE